MKHLIKTLLIIGLSSALPSQATVISGGNGFGGPSDMNGVPSAISGYQGVQAGILFDYTHVNSQGTTYDTTVVIGRSFLLIDSDVDTSNGTNNPLRSILDLEFEGMTPFTPYGQNFGQPIGWVQSGDVIDASTVTTGLGYAAWDYSNGQWQMQSNFAVDGTPLMAAFRLEHVDYDGQTTTITPLYGWVEFSVTGGSHDSLFQIDVSRWAYDDSGAGITAGSTSAVSAVPEPASAALMLAGLAGFCATRQRRPLLRKSA